MPKKILLGYQLHKNTHEYQLLKQQTINQIKIVLNQYTNPYVAFSGGKDSTVMLHLVVQQKPDIWVRHWDYGRALLPEFIEQEILKNRLSLAPISQFSYDKRPGGDLESARHSHISKSAFFPFLKRAIQDHTWDICFLGLRAEESTTRKIRTKQFIEYKKNCPVFFPIKNWAGKDIWTYICEYNLSIPSIYKTLAKITGNWNTTRLSTFFDDEFTHFGNLELSNFYLWQNKYV
jgi:3'-phosphoadenosine 5'-phosphosulfate sulfotransferase (PAPS reductase)/FAD synthetase